MSTMARSGAVSRPGTIMLVSLLTLLSLPPLSSAAVCWTVSVEFLVCVCRRWRQVAQSAGELHACLDTTATHHWLTATLSSALMCWIVSLEAVVQYVDDGSKWCSQQITRMPVWTPTTAITATLSSAMEHQMVSVEAVVPCVNIAQCMWRQ